MPDRYRALLFLGLPGTGKSTQGRSVGLLPGFTYTESGEVFRQLDTDSELGREVHAAIDRGELVPDELAVRVWLDHVDRRAEAGQFDRENDVLIVGGMPRTWEQAQLLEKRLNVLRVFLFEAEDEDRLMRRLSRRAQSEGREDDADPAVVRHRIEIHRQRIAPVLDFYTDARIVKIDAGRSVLEVLDQVVSHLAGLEREGVLASPGSEERAGPG
ncbi:MAG: adenylate kinase family protein [Phycisphaeraceae bacterium]